MIGEGILQQQLEIKTWMTLQTRDVSTNLRQKDLLVEKKKCAGSIFERNLHVDQGKDLVRNHEDSFDAQAACKEQKNAAKN